MLGKVHIREAIEDVLDRFDIDMKEKRKHDLLVALEGTLELLVAQDREKVLRALRAYPAARNALLKFWKMNNG